MACSKDVSVYSGCISATLLMTTLALKWALSWTSFEAQPKFYAALPVSKRRHNIRRLVLSSTQHHLVIPGTVHTDNFVRLWLRFKIILQNKTSINNDTLKIIMNWLVQRWSPSFVFGSSRLRIPKSSSGILRFSLFSSVPLGKFRGTNSEK
jgi:hypothetical protein